MIITKLREVYPNSEVEGFTFDSIDYVLCIQVKGTDVHNSLRQDKASNKDQIDLTYGETLPLGESPVDDFFPSIHIPQQIDESRHLKFPCRIWGSCIEPSNQKWIDSFCDVVRLTRNGRNPSLQLRGVDDLRKGVPEFDWIVFVHRSGLTSYEAFSLEKDQWNNPNGKPKQLLRRADGKKKVTYDLNKIQGSNQADKGKSAENIIYFGPPGTGKSTAVQTRVGGGKVLRTQFHPEYTHSEFIGSYRPVVGSEANPSDKVTGHDGVSLSRPVNYFAFVPGPFALALEKAFQCNDHIFLVIEEINRGDCAAIFGDMFQLLDRDSEGISEFGITPKPELLAYLVSKNINYDIAEDGKLYLPRNLSLLATMNTSDQSLYPMDSAFKRRWQWVACPIDFSGLLTYTGGTRPFIDDGTNKWDWISFLENLNKNIVRDRVEDKQLGPWFIKPERCGLVSFEAFLNKCLFYLWHDVFKDEQLSDFSPFKFDGQQFFGDFGTFQTNIRLNGLAAGLKTEFLHKIEMHDTQGPENVSDELGAFQQSDFGNKGHEQT